MEKDVDCIVIGGGPAGLSAAIYLGRFLRKVLVIDKGYGRSNYAQINENYLGFPNGIASRELRKRGMKQAQKFGVVFTSDEIDDIQKLRKGFSIKSMQNAYNSKSLILATGVTDNFPPVKGIHEYIGKSVFWCITCDGYKTIEKKIVVLGKDDEAACTCLQFLRYTKDITFVTNCDNNQLELSKDIRQRLDRNKIRFVCDRVTEINGKEGMITDLVLESGNHLKAAMVFSLQGAVPNSFLAQRIGVAVNEAGYIKVDLEQRTNIPFVYAAGDVTRNFSHQVATAVHEGSMAAQAANYDLYPDDLKE